MYINTDRRKKVITITAVSLITAAVLALGFFLIPWSWIAQSTAYSNSLPDAGDAVTAEQAEGLKTSGAGTTLADQDYLPMKFIIAGLHGNEDVRQGDGFVTLWAYCPKPYSFDQCPKEFNTSHPYVLTDTTFDAIQQEKQDIDVTVVGVIAHIGGAGINALTCKTPVGTSVQQGIKQSEQAATNLGDSARDRKYHRTLPKDATQEWLCQGFESKLFDK